jgi:lipoyl-dependent peroxiredoxin
MKRNATAVWHGTLKEGKGTLTTESGALKTVNYAFTNRFESTPGTNPEELIAAAHAGCFSMKFSGNLANAGLKPEKIETNCTITFEKDATGWGIRESTLNVKCKVPGATQKQVEEQAQDAKKNCPISQALNPNIKLTLNLTVEGAGTGGTPTNAQPTGRTNTAPTPTPRSR